MKAINVGELTGYDIGRRVAVTFNGAVITGELVGVSWIRYDSARGVECFRIEVATGPSSTFELKSIPLDYQIQIDREETS